MRRMRISSSVMWRSTEQPAEKRLSAASQANLYRVESDEKIQGIAPGQYSVIYDKDHHLCLGSGMIIDETK